MARLRRLSPEEAESASEDEFCPQSADISDPPLPKTRSSPRKNPRAQYAQCADSDDDDLETYVDNALLRPKNFVQSSGTKKRIQLSSLRPLTASNILPIGLELSRDEKRPKAGLKALKTELANSSEPAASRDPVCEEELKGPCPSNDDSEESDEELPSPRTLLGLARKPLTKVSEVHPNAIDLTKAVENLSLDPQAAAAVSRKRLQTSRNGNTSLDLNVTVREESEGENPGAFLRFSPPRFNNISRHDRSSSRPVTPPPHFNNISCTDRSSSRSVTSPPRFNNISRYDRSSSRPVMPPPQFPSKSRLQSPSKTKPRIPSPRLRESLDAFWDADTINHWNDQYSPQKPLRSPTKLKLISSPEDQKSPMSPLKKGKRPTKRRRAELEQRKGFDARKCEVAEAFLAELDNQIAEGKIGELARSTGGVRFVWSKTLKSTAGRANWRRETTRTRQPDGSMRETHTHNASIELAEKVISDEHRLLNVIAHEFCHLCNFMISEIKNQPHGAQFKEWGRKCTTAFGHRGVEVTTRHNYEIDYKYVWQCSNVECGVEFLRHSKSIDTKTHTCGKCHSEIVQIKPVPRKKANRRTGGYAAYFQEHCAETKKGMPGASHKQVMEAIGRKYRSEKMPTMVGIDLASMKRAGSTTTPEPTETVDSVARLVESMTLGDYKIEESTI